MKTDLLSANKRFFSLFLGMVLLFALPEASICVAVSAGFFHKAQQPVSLSHYFQKEHIPLMILTPYNETTGADGPLLVQLKRENNLLKRVLLTGLVVVILMMIAMVFVYRNLHRRQLEVCRQYVSKQQEAERMRTSLEAKKQEAERMRTSLEAKKQELTGQAFALAQSEEFFKNLSNDIRKLLPDEEGETTGKLNSLLTLLKSRENHKEQWKEFEERFNELNDNFLHKLLLAYPNLSPTETRLCAMLRMQLSTKEISNLTNRSLRTIEYTRTNIRKKMGLTPCDNLAKHLMTI